MTQAFFLKPLKSFTFPFHIKLIKITSLINNNIRGSVKPFVSDKLLENSHLSSHWMAVRREKAIVSKCGSYRFAWTWIQALQSQHALF